MKKFMDKDFLLTNKTAITLFEEHASQEPIFDYHCHLMPSQISENKEFSNLTEIWLYGDHYKWRAMRTVGIQEEFITGNASDYDKFLAWAETMPQLLGNPLYHWTHLELQRYFNIYDILNPTTAPSIWKRGNELLQSGTLRVANIFKQFNVAAVGTTDDPADDLALHKLINAGQAPIGKLDTLVLPSYRPDKALLPQAAGFSAYLEKLAVAAGRAIANVDDLIAALISRLEFFVATGCKASDHGIPMVPYAIESDAFIETAFQKAVAGEALTQREIEAYQTKVLLALGAAYANHDVVMQLHLNSIRNLNPPMFERLGPDTGFDASHDLAVSEKLAAFMGALQSNLSLPKTILYTLNPKDYYVLGSQMGCFQGDGIPGKIQLGSAWWFLDHKDGIDEQLRILANLGSLPRFIGMLTDSRSFLSYSRHEYFRRVLCNLVGRWAEDGEIPYDMQLLSTLVKDISYGNAKRYFG